MFFARTFSTVEASSSAMTFSVTVNSARADAGVVPAKSTRTCPKAEELTE